MKYNENFTDQLAGRTPGPMRKEKAIWNGLEEGSGIMDVHFNPVDG
jgi:hypothetical protein